MGSDLASVRRTITSPSVLIAADRHHRFYLVMVAAVAALSGLLFGFDTAVVNGGLRLRVQFHLMDIQAEIAAGALIAGAIFGAAVAGWTSDRFGRKKTLGRTAFLFAASSIGAALSSTILQFAAARLMGGIGIGSTLAPVYISEISVRSIRGRLVAIGFVNVIGTILAIFWLDRLGRRSLLLWTLAGTAVSLFALAGCFALYHISILLVTVSILAYVMCFAIGPGPMTWVYISEIFPSTARRWAASIATAALWIACFLVTTSFLSLPHYAGLSGGVFGLYAMLPVATFVFVIRELPETRRKSLEEIWMLWKKR